MQQFVSSQTVWQMARNERGAIESTFLLIIGLLTCYSLYKMFQSQYTSIKAEERIIIRRYTDGLAGDNALERAVQKHPIEPLSPWPEKRNKKETQIWQETDQSAR